MPHTFKGAHEITGKRISYSVAGGLVVGLTSQPGAAGALVLIVLGRVAREASRRLRVIIPVGDHPLTGGRGRRAARLIGLLGQHEEVG